MLTVGQGRLQDDLCLTLLAAWQGCYSTYSPFLPENLEQRVARKKTKTAEKRTIADACCLLDEKDREKGSEKTTEKTTGTSLLLGPAYFRHNSHGRGLSYHDNSISSGESGVKQTCARNKSVTDSLQTGGLICCVHIILGGEFCSLGDLGASNWCVRGRLSFQPYGRPFSTAPDTSPTSTPTNSTRDKYDSLE